MISLTKKTSLAGIKEGDTVILVENLVDINVKMGARGCVASIHSSGILVHWEDTSGPKSAFSEEELHYLAFEAIEV